MNAVMMTAVIWLNVYGAGTMSLPVTSYETCKQAMMYYAQHKDVYAVECSLKPNPYADNMR